MFFKKSKPEIFVLGNQKSGTSAIGHLIADASNISKTIDIPVLWPPYIQRLVAGELLLGKTVKSHRKYFRTTLVKEPNLTFLYGELLEIFPDAQYVFVVRNPFGNIRSILNRYQLDGSLQELSTEQIRDLGAHYNLFQAENWNFPAERNPIAVLAVRWKEAVMNYLKYHQEVTTRLARYEDFKADKKGFISRMCYELGLEVKTDIEEKLHIQFQPKGDHTLSYREFFGEENFKLIKNICWPLAEQFGYVTDG
ncbi:MAG: sulfotransferase [Cytophagales bacterium]|nr:sulfotransferase [Cytophagales bacterium]